MEFKTVIENISTMKALKRGSSEYVIDFKALTKDELKEALIKTAPQYYFEDNVRQMINACIYHEDPNIRRLMPILLKTILLNKEGFRQACKKTNDEVIRFEQSIVNQSNEYEISKNHANKDNLELFSYILEVSWKRGDTISVDEKNLILAIQEKLGISEEEYMLLEAKIGNFPKIKNTLHTNEEITQVKRELQRKGLIFKIRNDDGEDFDIIPYEVAMTLRNLFNTEMKKQGYQKLLENKRFRSKDYLLDIIEKSGYIFDKKMRLKEIKKYVLNNVRPSNLLGGFSTRDGLNTTDLAKWSKELDLSSSKTKEELIEQIIDYYDSFKEKPEEKEDSRSTLFDHYDLLAWRKTDALRKASIIEKDLECERLFEKATHYIFDVLLNVEPIDMIGSKHPDGVLSFSNKLIMWDNKSKEIPVHLKDHINQFDEYIKVSQKEVASFLVIGPDFTDDSQDEAMKYQLMNDTVITLITANELKNLAKNWQINKGEEPFPLGYFKQPGRFNPTLINF